MRIDPYIEFTVNGKTKTSSKRAKIDHPVWEPPEIFQFGNILLSNLASCKLLIAVNDAKILAMRGDEPVAGARVSLGHLKEQVGEVRKVAKLSCMNTGKPIPGGNVEIGLELITAFQARGTVRSTVYEYERYQPVIGWGSTYPGHILPSDLGTWQNKDAKTWGMSFSEVVSPTREGHDVLQSWGYQRTKKDPDGWMYSMAYRRTPWFKAAKVNTYVRRRLWVQTTRARSLAGEFQGGIDDETGAEPKKEGGEARRRSEEAAK
jgi:hypothetical protein